MPFEHVEAGKSVRQIIEETIEDMDRGLYDKRERREVIAKLATARVTTLPGSDDRKKIDELLRDIRERYGDIAS